MNNIDNFENEVFPILFNKINKNINKQYDKFLKPYALSKLHAFYLICLRKFDKGLKLNDLNSLIGCDKANTSRAITDLEEKGVVTRDTTFDNERKYFVKLTEYGNKIASYFINESKKKLNSMLSNLDEKEQEQLFYLINKLLKGEENDSNQKYC